ncbi:hypothetical protein LOTGIDRAFT_150991 [Lottia gigantea]|uniref:Nuclear receptor coactivator 4 N-terminal domain-containing protein n=1 Tax=Lottia gigantea TaxID=225164 RepID=V3ZQH2_LOTGI|nr:hypothetical protein LOTGIDRAFT_150991 [Lottia gigantea]ESO84755.1 hypothetical protein LOTGIDRAFT_150991 [Lottia gigantea]
MDSDINDKIEQLEKAIKQLDAVKRHLLHNATEIKGQVQTTMSRHLESLRNREVWLLSQVDLVFSAKEAVLQAQQARLNKMLGVLQSTIGLTADSNSNSNSILVETLQKLDINLNDLNPEETAFFTFRADPSDLRNTILNYGHVDANGMPLSGAFHEPESQTLPRHFEDYEGPDHHIFYKTVSDNKQNEDCGIYVNIPKLSTKAEDWLLYSTNTTTTTTSTDSTPRFSFPPFSSNWLDWIRQKSPSTPGMSSPTLRTISSDASIKDWLCQIKQYADPEEEEDFEIVDNSGLSTASSDSYTSIPDSIPVKPTVTNLDLIHLEFPTAVQSWLKTNRSTPEDKPYDFFQHVPSDPDVWLIHQIEKKKACEDCKPGLTTDIENLGERLNNLICTTNTSGYQSSCSTEDKQRCLQSETDLEMPHVLDVCKANELCDGFVDCVCSPHCGFQHIGITDNNHWLITKNQDDKDPCQNKAMEIDEKWLSPKKARTTNNQDFKVSFPLFEEITRDPECWLNTNCMVKDINFEEIFNSQCSNDTWLKSPMLRECNDNESRSYDIKNHHKETNTSDWLLQTNYGQSHPSDSNKQKWLMSHC